MFEIYLGKSDLFSVLTFVSIAAAVMCRRPASFLTLNSTGTCYTIGVDAVGESRNSVKCAALKIDDNGKLCWPTRIL